MKISVLSLCFAVSAALRADSRPPMDANKEPWVDECNKWCAHDDNPIVRPNLDRACESYRYVLPRPRVYRTCKNGFDEALAHACHEACNYRFGNLHGENAAGGHCAPMKDEVPRPVSYEACFKGFMAGTYSAMNYADTLRNKWMRENSDAVVDGVDQVDVRSQRILRAEEKAATPKVDKEAERKAVEELEAARAAARAAYAAAKKQEEAKPPETPTKAVAKEPEQAASGNETKQAQNDGNTTAQEFDSFSRM